MRPVRERFWDAEGEIDRPATGPLARAATMEVEAGRQLQADRLPADAPRSIKGGQDPSEPRPERGRCVLAHVRGLSEGTPSVIPVARTLLTGGT
jgi:hypothetical protein